MTKMVVSLEDQDDLNTSAETVWVQPLPNGNYTMQNIPTWAYDLDLDDEVAAHQGEDGRLHFDKVVKRSGNVAYRVIFLDGVDPAGTEASMLLSKVKQFATASEKYSDRYYIYNIPPGTDRKLLLPLLDAGEKMGYWNYESASDDPHGSELR